MILPARWNSCVTGSSCFGRESNESGHEVVRVVIPGLHPAQLAVCELPCPHHKRAVVIPSGFCPEGDWDLRLLCCGHEGQRLQLVHLAHEKAVGLVLHLHSSNCNGRGPLVSLATPDSSHHCVEHLELTPDNPMCCSKWMRRAAVPQSHRTCRSLPPSTNAASKLQ